MAATAVRKLRPDPIHDDVLTRVFQAATWAPSGGNKQPWRMVAVKDAGKKQALADLYAPLWAGFADMYRKGLAGLPAEEVEKAKRILVALQEAAAQGKGAAALDGRLIDAASERMANNVVKTAEAIAAKA